MDNENKYEKYLPIGTVVMLKEGKKRMMITGFCTVGDKDKTKIFDYSGCLYPEGFITSKRILLFNHDEIGQIYHLGYQNEEEKDFKSKLKETLNKMNNQN